MAAVVADLLRFIDASPTPFHAVLEAGHRLSAAGFRELQAEEIWDLSPGDARFLVRGGSSLLAFVVGRATPAVGGFRWIGAHTDSPNLRLKPRPDATAHGYRQLAVEPYGGVLLHTWLDRDLSLAGRVTLSTSEGPRSRLVAFERPLLRVPSLAIHLQRELAQDGLKLNAQQHVVPVAGLEEAPELAELVASELRAGGDKEVTASDLLGFDLMLHDVQPACVVGTRGEMISAPRLDNLASCHAAVSALVRAAARREPGDATCGIVLHDHEEVGSRSAQGAGGPLLAEAFERIVAAFKGGEPQGLARALARSRLVSADMAHAVHPNHADRHEPGHRPVLGRGPVLKVNTNQSYATDGEIAAEFASICRARGVEPQYFVTRSDLACGSTIGPITAARVGIRTVDVGSPMLAMHSCRELAGTADVAPMIDVLSAFLEG
jgi:aspartyl aminopeptidase